MSETKYISNLTSFTKINGNISIKTEYNDNSLPNILQSIIANIIGNQDNISYIEGELVIQSKNNPEQIDYILNNKGELIIIGSSGCEVKSYSIVNGYLMYIGNGEN